MVKSNNYKTVFSIFYANRKQKVKFQANTPEQERVAGTDQGW